MLVILDSSLFAAPVRLPDEDLLRLLAVVHLGWEERHIVTTDPPYDPDGSGPVHDWLAGLPASLADLRAIAQAVFTSAPAKAARRSKRATTIHIAALATSAWTATPPRLTLKDGLAVLQTPLLALVENRRSDGVMVKRLAIPGLHRELLTSALARKWLRFESSGGIEQLALRLSDCAGDHHERLRLWVLCDRDSAAPDGLSKAAQQVESNRGAGSPSAVPFGPLQRRMAESYLPLEALERWSEEGTVAERRKRRRIYAAFEKLPLTLRWRYHMKDGLLSGFPKERKEELRDGSARRPNSRGKAPEDEDLRRAFPAASPAERAELRRLTKTHLSALRDGFGDSLRKLFDSVAEAEMDAWLKAEVADDERFELVQSLLERL